MPLGLVRKTQLTEFMSTLPAAESSKVRNLLYRLKLVDQRKTTLYRLLEEILVAQADYLRTGDPVRRRPLAQRALASKLEVDASVINRLISNKSVQMPWGVEAPLGVFFPSAKDINRELLYALVCAKPELADEELRRELARLHGVLLSRRSVAQYRQELSVGGREERARALRPSA